MPRILRGTETTAEIRAKLGITGGSTSANNGLSAFSIDGNGHLIASFPDSNTNFSINANGHLIYTY
jgi:hypothetical protein